MRTVLLGAVVHLLLGCGGNDDDDDWHGPVPIGGGSNGGSYGSAGGSGGNSSGGSGNASGSTSTAGSSGEGGSADPGPTFEAPQVTSFGPTEGDYGTLITIEGSGLGSAARNGVVLAVGDQGEVELYPDSSPEVVSWSETRLEFRYPFPAKGGVSIETPEGAELAGHFDPSWVVLTSFDGAPNAPLLASIASGPASIAALFDSTPPRLFELDADGGREITVDASGVAPSTLRLYLDSGGVLQGFGLSDEPDPEIIALENDAGELVATGTGLLLGALEHATAGGPDGAAIWLRRDDGWRRARPASGVWAIDKGPIADPSLDEPLHASGASSDGSLYVAHGVDTSSFLDDTETPYVVRLPPAATEFDAAFAGGHATDDYLTSLSLEGRGRGVVVHYCGSDVDPFGLSGTDYVCFNGLAPSEAGQRMFAPREGSEGVHTMTKNLGLTSHCEDDDAYTLRRSSDAEMDPGEVIVFTCRTPVALEVDQNDEPILLMRDGDTLRALVHRPTN